MMRSSLTHSLKSKHTFGFVTINASSMFIQTNLLNMKLVERSISIVQISRSMDILLSWKEHISSATMERCAIHMTRHKTTYIKQSRNACLRTIS